MLRMTNEARCSAVQEINRLIEVVNHIPGDKLSYIDAQRITKYLCEFKEEIRKEYKECLNVD